MKYPDLFESLADAFPETIPSSIIGVIEQAETYVNGLKCAIPDTTRTAVVILKCYQSFEPLRFFDYDTAICALLLPYTMEGQDDE
ncbi:hypothetical protein [Xanthomonas axonopodis]